MCKRVKQPARETRGASAELPRRVFAHHVHLLGILWFALSAVNLMGGLFLLILGSTLFPHLREIRGVPPDVPTHFLTYLFSTLGIVVLAKALCGFIAAWGLLRVMGAHGSARACIYLAI